MTDQEQLVAMLRRAGHQVDVANDGHWRGYGEGRGVKEVKCTELTVHGHFYDFLSAYFDDGGTLLAMESHVAIGRSTDAMREEWRKQQGEHQ